MWGLGFRARVGRVKIQDSGVGFMLWGLRIRVQGPGLRDLEQLRAPRQLDSCIRAWLGVLGGSPSPSYRL